MSRKTREHKMILNEYVTEETLRIVEIIREEMEHLYKDSGKKSNMIVTTKTMISRIVKDHPYLEHNPQLKKLIIK